MTKLTTKQQLFVDKYMVNGFNATQAAIKAGYGQTTARSQGQRLLTNTLKKYLTTITLIVLLFLSNMVWLYVFESYNYIPSTTTNTTTYEDNIKSKNTKIIQTSRTKKHSKGTKEIRSKNPREKTDT